MTPRENIYMSEHDIVDGLVDVEKYAEDFTNDSIDTLRDMMEDDQYDIYDYDDDGQPDEYTEYQDLYTGDDWDFGQYDYYDDVGGEW